MLLGLLKRSPAGVVKDVGVQLMLFASCIEVVKVCPSNLDNDRGSNGPAALELRKQRDNCLLYTSPSPRDLSTSRMPSSA